MNPNDTNVNTSLKQFKQPSERFLRAQSLPYNQQPSTSGSTTEDSVARSLTSAVADFPNQQKTIMEQFAERRALAAQGSRSQEELIRRRADEAIGEAESETGAAYTTEQESGRGFAVNMGVLRNIVNTGDKRVRELERSRDDLLLQNKVAEASRLDSLMVDEQNLISQARRDMIENLKTLGSETRAFSEDARAQAAEGRAVAGFETPAQKSARELSDKTKQAVLTLMQTAPDANILSTDSYDEAVEKYRSSKTYSLNRDVAEAELRKINADIEATNALADQRRTEDSGGMRSLSVSPDAPQAESLNSLLGAAQNLASQFSTKFQQESFLNNLDRLAQSGDPQQLADYVFTNAISTLPDADTRKKTLSRFNLVKKLNTVEDLLADYEALGGKTNIFAGNLQKAKEKVGLVGDPELARIGTLLLDTVDSLSRDRTGAALTPSEEKFYERLLPSTFRSAALNQQNINGLRDSLLTDVNSVVSFQLTGSGLESIQPFLRSNLGMSSAPSGSRSLGGSSLTSPLSGSTPKLSLPNPDNLFSSFFTQ